LKPWIKATGKQSTLDAPIRFSNAACGGFAAGLKRIVLIPFRWPLFHIAGSIFDRTMDGLYRKRKKYAYAPESVRNRRHLRPPRM